LWFQCKAAVFASLLQSRIAATAHGLYDASSASVTREQLLK
jgi:hypothetical protein